MLKTVIPHSIATAKFGHIVADGGKARRGFRVFILSLMMGFSLGVPTVFAPSALAEQTFLGQPFDFNLRPAKVDDNNQAQEIFPDLNSSYQQHLEQSRKILKQEGYQRWNWLQSDCTDCPLFILPRDWRMENRKVYEFIRTLESHKSELLRIYGSSPQEYNLLAHMAVGILGRESDLFTSTRYHLKESAQWGVSSLKHSLRVVLSALTDSPVRISSLNSRGPTQIKIVPAKIAEAFDVSPSSLNRPEHAALATMGYLIEALAELKRRVVLNDLDHVNAGNYVDYLPYIYFGSRRQLLNREATPDQNLYIQDMRRYMYDVEIYEGPPGSEPLPQPEMVSGRR